MKQKLSLILDEDDALAIGSLATLGLSIVTSDVEALAILMPSIQSDMIPRTIALVDKINDWGKQLHPELDKHA